MNRLFRVTQFWDRAAIKYNTERLLNPIGAQRTVYNDLLLQEVEREVLFKRELRERNTEDVLDRALLKAYHAKKNGVLQAPEYYKIYEKVQALKKL